MVMWQACTFIPVASASCQLFNTCCDPAVSFTHSSFPYRKDGLFTDTNLQQPAWGACTSWMSSQPWRKSSKKLKAVLVLSSLMTFSLSASLLRGFGVSWTVSDTVFKADILRTCDSLIYLKDRFLQSVHAAVPTTYWIRVLEVIDAKRSGLWD